MTPPTTAAATVRDVTMRFRGHTALDGVSTVIERDSITGLLGRNGAGKTTLMQLLTGHRVPTSGSVEVLGGAPYENDGVLSRICFVKEGQRYPDHFRVRDALDAAALVYPDWDAGLAAELLRDFDLPAKRPVKKLSRGMTSAVGIVIGWPPGRRSRCSTSPTWAWTPSRGSCSTTGCWPTTPSTRARWCCPPT